MKGLMRALVIAAGLLCAVAVAPALGAVAGTTTKAPGVMDFQGVACPPNGSCVGVGETPRNKQNFSSGVFAEISSGKPGPAHIVPGTNSLNRIDCPSANFCIAVGFSFSGSSQHAVFVTIDHGKASKAQDLGISSAASIGCGSPTSCWVPGDNFPQKGGTTATPMLVHLVDGNVAKVYALTGTYSFSAAESGGPTPQCTSATSCILAGSSGFTANATGLIFSMNNGKVTDPDPVPGTSAISGLDCTSASFCTLVGYKTNGSSQTGEVTTLSSGKLGPVEAVQFALFPLACETASACYSFGGVFSQTTSQEYVVPINKGEPGSPAKIDSFVSAATCKGEQCLGVGSVGQFPNAQGTVFSFKG